MGVAGLESRIQIQAAYLRVLDSAIGFGYG
jgi:hypothetical protein